MAGQVNDYSLD